MKAKCTLEKVVFLGTPVFAVPTLELLSQTRYKPLLVVTQPDRKQGRNMMLTAPPVKQKAIEHAIETIQPEDINEEFVIDRISYFNPDLIITVAYGGMLKRDLLAIPKYGCINLHPSLLPKYRGASPINYALFNGDKTTGNSIIRMVKKMDSGAILYQSVMSIDEKDNASSLSDKLAQQGANDVLEVLTQMEEGTLKETEQDEKLVTYSRKLSKEETVINWKQSAEAIRAKVRGLADEPGAVTFFRGQRLKILEVEILKQTVTSEAGTIAASGDVAEISNNNSKGIVVASNDYDILITLVQPAGKKVMTAFDYHLGARIKPGERISEEH